MTRDDDLFAGQVDHVVGPDPERYLRWVLAEIH